MNTGATPALNDAARSFFSPAIRKSESSDAKISASPTDLLETLSHTEFAVLVGLVNGMRSKAIAEVLTISPKTVFEYKRRILAKFGIESTRGFARWLSRYWAQKNIFAFAGEHQPAAEAIG